MLSSDQITRLSKSIDILDVFDYYQIAYTEKNPGNYEAYCPFHHEKTPSVKIRTDDNIWTAFCCNRGHDAFALMREMEDTFIDAIAVLQKLSNEEAQTDFGQLVQALTQTESESEKRAAKRVNALHYYIGIEIREWLKKQSKQSSYEQKCHYADSKLTEIDRFFQSEATVEEVETFYNCIIKELKAQ